MFRPLAPIVAAALLALVAAASGGGAAAEVGLSDPSTADHGKFEALQGDFDSGPEVTRACLECHTEAAKQVRESIHWTWEFTHPETGQTLGKRHVLNNFCTNLSTNEPRCTSCHAGYGWEDDSFDFSQDARVDCLVCHDTTGTYAKHPKQAGRVLKTEVTVHGKTKTPPDLGEVARSVGKPTRQTCGSCHFQGGGGDGSKHGDLDSSLIDPPRSVDVHMSPDGGDLACQDCHRTSGHQISGSRYDSVAQSEQATGPHPRRHEIASCESCHGGEPHERAPAYIARTLDQHGDRVACQTCHVPKLARGGVATKVWWDWSEAGRLGPDGQRLHSYNADGRTQYWTNWGEIRWAENFAPSYAWWDGDVRYRSAQDEIDPESVVSITTPEGGPDDPDARIWPFKIMRGKQPYDAGRDRLALMHLFGRDDTAYWANLDWPAAIDTAMRDAGLPFSGEVGFVETRMHWPIAHMVAPAEDALTCADCHSRDSRMAGIAGVYLPGRDGWAWLDLAGTAGLLLTLLGVLGHAGLRIRHHLRKGART